MSHIAAALAKSKGKQVLAPSPEGLKAVPTLRIGPAAIPVLKSPGAKPVAPKAPSEPTVSVPPATPPKIGVVVAVVAVIVAIVGVSAWLLLKKDSTFARPAAPAPALVMAPATPPIQAKTKAEPVVLEAVSAKTPSPELKEKVRLLPITGAAGGGSQRLSVAGKVYEPGDTVVEGLILQAIENDEIVFRDAEGNLYTRRL